MRLCGNMRDTGGPERWLDTAMNEESGELLGKVSIEYHTRSVYLAGSVKRLLV